MNTSTHVLTIHCVRFKWIWHGLWKWCGQQQRIQKKCCIKTTTFQRMLFRDAVLVSWHDIREHSIETSTFFHITILTCRNIFNISFYQNYACKQNPKGKISFHTEFLEHTFVLRTHTLSRRCECAHEKIENRHTKWQNDPWCTRIVSSHRRSFRFSHDFFVVPFWVLRKHEILIFVNILFDTFFFCCCCHYFSSWKSNQSTGTHAIDADVFFSFPPTIFTPSRINFNSIHKIWKGVPCSGSSSSPCAISHPLIAMSFHQTTHISYYFVCLVRAKPKLLFIVIVLDGCSIQNGIQPNKEKRTKSDDVTFRSQSCSNGNERQLELVFEANIKKRLRHLNIIASPAASSRYHDLYGAIVTLVLSTFYCVSHLFRFMCAVITRWYVFNISYVLHQTQMCIRCNNVEAFGEGGQIMFTIYKRDDE